MECQNTVVGWRVRNFPLDIHLCIVFNYSLIKGRGRTSNAVQTDIDHFNMLEIYDNDQDDDDLPPFRSAGGLNTPSSSHASSAARVAAKEASK